jgi:hypothetical protein
MAVNVSYHPQWMRLGEAVGYLERSCSMSPQAAKDWLLRAIQDLLRADAERYKAQTMFRVAGFPTQWKHRGKPDWPARLTHDRIDWDASTINGQDPVRIIDNDLLMEVSAAALLPYPDAVRRAARQPDARRRKRTAAEEAVAACYPDGVPSDVLNPLLCRTVANWLKTNRPNMPKMDDVTIKRAAGRAK